MEHGKNNQNVDHQEIAHFAGLASRWWDKQGEFKTLHQINPLRLDYIERGAAGLFGKNVLDVGCGGGILAESMAVRGAKVTAIDMGKEQIEVAKLHALETGSQLSYLQTTAEAHAEEHPAAYDVVTCMEMIEHVPDPGSVIAACAQLVKPGGKIFVSTINRTPKAYLYMILAAEKLLKIVPNGTHQHDKFIRPSELLAWADDNALRSEAISGVQFFPVIESFRLSNNVDVNYMVQLAKPELNND
ncbi:MULTISPECIES: bifunctional 2-polyprenyl-6-hydroxyphenol methylase/3-demethylubiquinol 3-O-methyltransferase UbiG [unclassified Agarivorans]|uniref:bifunctional 2-polyprenyl-6-hydroxyphenol methylase/3-demethylubiquinol 3-O-methyltransferase UbiG n=1 Tax=unclassified Agarivorans TaxID=2636026 RepID=UPI0010DA7122|nr:MULTISPECIES: bifunctional 2-polyprenyl-6-hydroxyphenol methylase/3-demethylubiquinol 3-O-methyltransferase UbiG [unclassified Agarivorans]MDO6686199.1 bifunctional 2-polyprenyl-6-hydroxyphenol methylase/3-demethylubiquinol 3-O-methyltransferase UbiG [Agarivorans sp. 3_MG-2023]MDO6716352.1 bifunctional 2-polyprenyl-6-hydroxyphenol methylase/3-demethylubiquinol 3-O-methyltransferase UbiG [Agarivorans sp. 2_MG-2023]MDO6764732.1 bifunctional 2-polyprenyl-6-hydroxyphenol methylase/3-demethylubiqu